MLWNDQRFYIKLMTIFEVVICCQGERKVMQFQYLFAKSISEDFFDYYFMHLK
jgi:hypothetical protein